MEEGVTLHGSHEALLRVRRGPALQREGLTQETLHPPVPGPHDVPLQDPRRGTQHQGCLVRQVWALRSSCTEHEAQKFLEAPGWCRATCQALVYSASVYSVYRHALSPPISSLHLAGLCQGPSCHLPLPSVQEQLCSDLIPLLPTPTASVDFEPGCSVSLPAPPPYPCMCVSLVEACMPFQCRAGQTPERGHLETKWVIPTSWCLPSLGFCCWNTLTLSNLEIPLVQGFAFVGGNEGAGCRGQETWVLSPWRRRE